MKTLIVLISSVLALSSIAETDAETRAANKKRFEEVYTKKLGGRLLAPGSLKGTIGFVDRSSGIDHLEINKMISTVSKEMKYNYKVQKQEAKGGLPSQDDVRAVGCDVAIFIVSDAHLPPMLVAPEERWSLVNVEKLRKGLKEDVVGKRLLGARCRGELMRAFALVCGNGTSQYPNNVLDAITVEGLDETDPDVLVFDMYQRCKQHLERLGITPKKLVTYSAACQQGWAPEPTNDVQRAIWNKVHSTPDKPIKIQFDPKRDAGK